MVMTATHAHAHVRALTAAPTHAHARVRALTAAPTHAHAHVRALPHTLLCCAGSSQDSRVAHTALLFETLLFETLL
jgi:hypothetical protein